MNGYLKITSYLYDVVDVKVHIGILKGDQNDITIFGKCHEVKSITLPITLERLYLVYFFLATGFVTGLTGYGSIIQQKYDGLIIVVVIWFFAFIFLNIQYKWIELQDKEDVK
jgi:hypothetical protein